jgi:hypothetical protein
LRKPLTLALLLLVACLGVRPEEPRDRVWVTLEQDELDPTRRAFAKLGF